MAKTSRRDLTEPEKACASRAKDLWEKKRENEGIRNQNAPAEALGITQGGFSQFINGIIPIPAEMKARMASYFQVSIKTIDPDFYTDIGLPDPDLDAIETEALKHFRAFHGTDKAVLLGMLIASENQLRNNKQAADPAASMIEPDMLLRMDDGSEVYIEVKPTKDGSAATSITKEDIKAFILNRVKQSLAERDASLKNENSKPRGGRSEKMDPNSTENTT